MNLWKKYWLIGMIGILVVILVIAVIVVITKEPQELNNDNSGDQATNTTKIKAPEVLARGLDTPWDMTFLPSGEVLITERPGRVRLYLASTGLKSQSVIEINDVVEAGEGGLLGITIHPQFAQNNFVYLYYTYRKADGQLANKVVRMTYATQTLKDPKIILDNIPGNSLHNGGRIRFGPDNLLYVATGDAQDKSQAQDIGYLAGKILRLNDDGTIPSSNPLPDKPLYSYGHRNPQGLAWDASGQLWATEHGQDMLDEVNMIRAAVNYGWPTISGDQKDPSTQSPEIHSGSDTWAPSGMAFVGDTLYFAGLRGKSLYSLDTGPAAQKPLSFKRHLQNTYGRLRNVSVGPDGLLYILTSNQDGRGEPTADDDRLIRIDSRSL